MLYVLGVMGLGVLLVIVWLYGECGSGIGWVLVLDVCEMWFLCVIDG